MAMEQIDLLKPCLKVRRIASLCSPGARLARVTKLTTLPESACSAASSRWQSSSVFELQSDSYKGPAGPSQASKRAASVGACASSE